MTGRAMTAANDPRVPAVGNVRAATGGDTGRPTPDDGTTTTPSSDTTHGTRTSTGSGREGGASEPADRSRNSNGSGSHLPTSKRRWRQPKDAGDLATQASHVATMVLNGDIDPDVARLYTASARVAAQAMSTKVSKARFLGSTPDLSLDDDPFE